MSYEDVTIENVGSNYQYIAEAEAWDDDGHRKKRRSADHVTINGHDFHADVLASFTGHDIQVEKDDEQQMVEITL